MKIVTEYEVEGGWTEKGGKCRCCGKQEQLVPKKGHYNSRYWELQRNDGLFLYCCPDGCSVKNADIKMNYLLAFKRFLKEGAESYNYELDYKKIKYFFLDRKGVMYPCAYHEHDAIADDFLNLTRNELEEAGYVISIALSGPKLLVYCSKEISKAQLNTLLDWAHEKGYKTKELVEEAKHRSLGIYFPNKMEEAKIL